MLVKSYNFTPICLPGKRHLRRIAQNGKVLTAQKYSIYHTLRGGMCDMEILKPAMAGTLESSDAQVMVEPGEDGIELTLESSVMNQYGRQIKATVLETLERLGVENARVAVVDKGALDCTIKARVECAVFRSCGQSAADIPWGGAIR